MSGLQNCEKTGTLNGRSDSRGTERERVWWLRGSGTSPLIVCRLQAVREGGREPRELSEATDTKVHKFDNMDEPKIVWQQDRHSFAQLA